VSVRSRHDLLRRLRRRPLGLAGLIGAGLFVLIAVVGPWLSPYDPLMYAYSGNAGVAYLVLRAII